MLHRAPPQRTTSLRLRVTLRDTDFNLHMNYASYLEAMERGRWDWSARNRLLPAWLRHKIRPVVGSMEIHYRKELKPWARYVLQTSVTGFDRRAIVFEQVFLVGDRVHASGKVNALLVGPKGLLSPEEMNALLPVELRV